MPPPDKSLPEKDEELKLVLKVCEKELRGFESMEPEKLREELAETFRNDKSLDLPDSFTKFFPEEFGRRFEYRLFEELKRTDVVGTRAWRAWQNLNMKNIEIFIRDSGKYMREGQELDKKTLRALRATVSRLQKLEKKIDTRLPDEPFAEAMDRYLGLLREQLVEAVERNADRVIVVVEKMRESLSEQMADGFEKSRIREEELKVLILRLLENQQDDKKRNQELAERLGVAEGAIAFCLGRLGADSVPRENYAEKLLEFARHYKELLEQLERMGLFNSEADKLRPLVRHALEAGQLDQAEQLLRRMQQLVDGSRATLRQEVERQDREAA